MAGGSGHAFTGTFDGQGKTLTFNYTVTGDNAVPFRNVESGCVIQNLCVDGTINTTYQCAAGLVAQQYGKVIIKNCRVSVTIRTVPRHDPRHLGTQAGGHLRGGGHDGPRHLDHEGLGGVLRVCEPGPAVVVGRNQCGRHALQLLRGGGLLQESQSARKELWNNMRASKWKSSPLRART